MNSLTITQTKANGIVEGPVSNLIITKLYNIGKDDDEHQTLTVGVDTTDENRPVSTVSGRIRVNSAFANQLEYLAVKFPDLEINADSTYIYFEDPEVERVLLAAGIGDGTGITMSDAANANLGTIFKNNTTITSFNTFEYFNRANTSPTNEMFRGCTNLENIDLSNVTRFSNRLFQGTNITDVNAPNLVSSDSSVFVACPSLQSVTSLGDLASIPDSMFWECSNLQTVNLPDNCVTISGSAFIIWNGSTGSLQQVNGIEHVSSFGYRCFLRQKMLRLTANDLANAVSIGEKAFLNVLVSSINSPKLMTLGEYSFANNSALTTIECLGKVSNIPPYCFDGDSSLLTVKVPYLCADIGNCAFRNNSSLTSIKQYTDSIDDWVEGEEPTTGPLSRVTSFGLSCFEDCSLLSLTLQDIQNATTIKLSAFKNTLLSGDIVLPQLSTISGGAFFGTRITSIDLTGSSISSLPSAVFQNCSSLSKISIPTSVTYLDAYWGDGIANVLTLEGFDNCANHSLYNWQLYNKTILNPIKTSFVDGVAIMALKSNNNENINYNLLYNPSITSTMPGLREGNWQYYTYFIERISGGSCRVNISLLYFRDISSFGALTFFKCNIDNLVINNVTPPTLNYRTEDLYRYYNTQVWDNNIFPTGNSDQNDNVVIGTLWVPDSAIATYQADPLYSHLNIKGINTKTNGTDYDLPRYATYAAWKVAEEAAVAQGGHAVTGIIEEYM